MKSLDIYQLTRIDDNSIFAEYEAILSGREEKKVIKRHEQESLNIFVNELVEHGIGAEGLNYYYYSYAIPQIAKEFDLLRINDNTVLNIELKSQETSREKIEKQLLQNKYYLSHLSRMSVLFTFIASNKKVYQLTRNGIVSESDINTLIDVIYRQRECYSADINSLFRASNFLVSPINTPDKFINNEYFLTQQQQKNKDDIVKELSDFAGKSLFCSITGGPGTGKTLALYDLARHCSAFGRVCIIHCGALSEGHLKLNQKINNFDIYEAKKTDSIDFSQYPFIFIDEAHRFYRSQFDVLVEAVLCNKAFCVFSYDEQQTLSKRENNSGVVKRIRELTISHEYRLSDKIRTNKELASFISRLLGLGQQTTQSKYPSVTVIYANTVDEVKFFIEKYRKSGYFFINYTTSIYSPDPFSKFVEDTNTHRVIGQEFNNVLMIIDDTFIYNNKGELIARKSHPNPDYLYRKLLFQGLTRARERLALIIFNNVSVFSKILQIIGN